MKIKIAKLQERREEEKRWIFKKVTDAFFEGTESFEEFEPVIGGIWIAKHGYKRIKRADLYNLQATMREQGMEAPHLSRVDRSDPDYGYIPEFETLTIEPKEGGQYEVAVRIWSEGKWRGYKISEFDPFNCFLVGVNTGGH